MILAALTVGGVVLFFWLLISAQIAIVTFFVALVLSTALKPLLSRLDSVGISPTLGVLLIYAIGAFLITVMAYLFGSLLYTQVQAVTADIPLFYARFKETLATSDHFIAIRLGRSLPDVLRFNQMPEAADGATVQRFFETANGFTRFIFFFVVTLTLAFHWSIAGEATKRNLLLLFPMSRREQIRDLLREIETKLGSYIVGQGILVVVIGVLAFIAYLLIGLPYALALALFAGLMELVPIIGPLIGALPAFLVAITVSPTAALLVLVASGLIQMAENNFIVPRVMNEAVGVNPLVTLLAFAAFGAVFGLVGAIISIPLAAVLQIMLDQFLLKPMMSETVDDISGRDKVSVLRYRTRELINDIRQSDGSLATTDEMEEQLESIAVDLDNLLAAEAA